MKQTNNKWGIHPWLPKFLRQWSYVNQDLTQVTMNCHD